MFGFENPGILALLVVCIPLAVMAIRRDKLPKKLIAVSKIVTVSLIVGAAASPYMTVEDEVMEKPELVVLKDNSRSASLMESPEFGFEDVNVREKIIASGNSSDLRSGILRNLERNKAYLLVSDLQSTSSLEGLDEKFRQKNSTLYAMETEMTEDVSVSVEGPEKTVPGATNSFTVKTRSTGDPVKPEVTLDGSPVSLEKTGESTWQFRKSFDETGSHAIEASVNVEDRFSENNRFYRTVNVREKPKILVLGQKSRLGEEMEQFYDVTYRSELPDDLSPYYSVIAKKKFNPRDLADFTARGNGLIYTGDHDENNYLLPVRPSTDADQSEGAKIMIIIDISKGTDNSGAHTRSIEIAYSLVDKLPFNNEVGIIAYNQEAYLLSKPKPLATNRQELKTKISRLEANGNSFHHNGLQGAEEAMNDTGNIIMISDGKISRYGANVNTDQKSKQIASQLQERLITVGVGEDRNTEFLKELANEGDGFYLDAEQSGRLNFVFEAGDAQSSANGLVVIDKNHFITQGIETSTRTSGFDPVKLKTGADMLVTSTDGRPFLSSWRYGLGRVASFTGGSSDLERVLTTDPLLVTRAVSWSVGEPQRKQENWMNIGDSRSGQEVKVEASYDLPGLKRQSTNRYTGTLEPEENGFHSYQDRIYGYSYNPELEKIGYSDKLEELTGRTGGSVYSPGEQEEIKNDLENFSNRKITTKKSVADYFILAALIVFLAEIGYRKTRGKK